MDRKWIYLVFLGLLSFLLWTGVASRLVVTRAGAFAESAWRSHRTDLPVASPAVAAVPAPGEVKGGAIVYGVLEGKPVRGYLARPARARGALPALIVIHEWWGLNPNIRKMTEKLAGEGYTALAVDLYGGRVAENPETARQLMSSALQDTPRLRENLALAYRYLEGEEKAPKVGSIGWCFGGTWSLETALLFPDRLDAAVIYYGGGIVTDPERLKPLRVPILGIFGELDNNPSPATVRQFEAALKSLDKSVEIYIYPGADHAFANPSGTRYNESAARDAWRKTIAFLKRNLGGA